MGRQRCSYLHHRGEFQHNLSMFESVHDGEYVPSLLTSVNQSLGLEMYLLLCESGGDHTMLVHHDKVQELSLQGHKSKFNLEYGLFE